MEMRNKIYLITTGGTIEKTYDESDGSLANRGTFIKELIKSKLRLPSTTLEAKAIMSMDSLLMTDTERKMIAMSVNETAQHGCPIVVLHGTDTLSLTAKFCLEHLPHIKVPVVFTGAMKPVGFEDSDAIQNVTEALAFAKILPAGWYVSFHNQVFSADNVRKNHQRLTFEAIRQ